MTTTIDAAGQTRTLTTGNCDGCGCQLQLWLLDGQRMTCCDCRDTENRKARGWHPENSRD